MSCFVFDYNNNWVCVGRYRFGKGGIMLDMFLEFVLVVVVGLIGGFGLGFVV